MKKDLPPMAHQQTPSIWRRLAINDAQMQKAMDAGDYEMAGAHNSRRIALEQELRTMQGEGLAYFTSDGD